MRRTVIAVALILILVTTSMFIFAQSKRAEKAKDPVCGIMVDKDPNLSLEYRGETFYFCSKSDMDKFRQEPERYLRKR
jgi:YHS domain-containing protein